MAELICKVRTNGPEPKLQDRDVIHGYNDRHISAAHLWRICHPWEFVLNSDGVLATGTIVEDYFRHISLYKFEQLSRTVVRRTDLLTLQSEEFDNRPNAKGEQMNVLEWLAGRLGVRNLRNGGPKKPIFGVPGAYVWYGKDKQPTQAQCNLIWTDVETKTAVRQADHQNHNFHPHVLRRFLVVRVDDFTERERADMEEPLVDMADPNNPVTIKTRTRFVPYDTIPILKNETANIRNPNVEADTRGRQYKRINIVEVKP